mgnify:CR=1 FL=1
MFCHVARFTPPTARRWKTRLCKRNKDYMKLPDPYLAMWYHETCKFAAWAIQRGVTRTAIMPGFKPENRGMGNVWAQFLRETGHPGTNWVDVEAELASRGITGMSFEDALRRLRA